MNRIKAEYYSKRLEEIKASLGDRFQKDCFLIDNLISVIQSEATEEPAEPAAEKLSFQEAANILIESGIFTEEMLKADEGLIKTILKYKLTAEELRKILFAMKKKENLDRPAAYLIAIIMKKKK